MMLYHRLDKKRHKDQVKKVAFTLQLFGDGSVFFSGFGAIDVYIWPQNQKKHGSAPLPKTWYRLFTEAKM